MNRVDPLSETGDWFVDTVRNKPEALLLLAAGCALMVRGNGGGSRRTGGQTAQGPATGRSPTARSVYGAAESASEYASDLKERVSDAASSYARTASDYAEDAGRNLSRQAETTLAAVREQPWMIAGLGLAAGAALAALFPATAVEKRTLATARESLKEAAGEFGQNLAEAAGEATEKLKEGAAQRGLNPEGLKELAREATDTFTSTAAAKPQRGASEPRGAPSSLVQVDPTKNFDLPPDDRHRGDK